MIARTSILLATAFVIPTIAMADGFWIWRAGDGADAEGSEAFVRKDFGDQLAGADRVRLFAAADNSATVWVNGQRVIKNEAWDAPSSADITGMVKDGASAITVQAKNADGPAGLFLRIDVTRGEETTHLYSDESWSTNARPQQGWHESGFEAPAAWAPAVQIVAFGADPYASVNDETLLTAAGLGRIESTPVEQLTVAEGFEVERLYSVPKGEFGSWVTLCEDDKGRLIAGDQYGHLYRMTPPAPGAELGDADIERIDLDIGHAWGLCYAFDSLYVVVNDKAHGGRGLYRVQDTNGDDNFDKVELLKKFEEVGGEHGPHAVLPSPDGESLYVVCGNQTSLPENYDRSRVAEVWGEDNLNPRVYGKGFMKGVEAPRGWIAKTDPEGREWEIIATGFRNQYDIGFDANGEIFTFDADMEWDLNTPWYRPTRVNHVISGAEFGWRNGSAKWPDYYSDSFGATVNVGPGSPTGVTFGTGAKFPAKYQRAFFICDWSYGKLYAVHHEAAGATYTGTVEEFVLGQPLPLTDILIHSDGAMYFAVGGRRVQSGLYRVTYTGDEPTDPADPPVAGAGAREKRYSLERFHGIQDPAAVDAAWPHLGSEDRALRFAARTALEHQPAATWANRALAEEDPAALLGAALSLARTGDPSHGPKLLERLNGLSYGELSRPLRFDLLRAYALTFIRLGEPTDAQRAAAIAAVGAHFPTNNRAETVELSNLLAYLGDPSYVPRAVDRLEAARTQEEQIALAKDLRLVTGGWTPELRERYFGWFVRAANYKGGASFRQFMDEIKANAVARLSDEEKASLKEILNAQPPAGGPQFTLRPRAFVKQWTMEDIQPLLASGLEGGRDFESGRDAFGSSSCYACHRFNDEGGSIGPDLTSARGKFSPNDLLEQIIAPSQEISDQYGSMVFQMKDGSTVTGRIANLSGDDYRVITDLFAPGEMVAVNRNKVESVDPNPISMMPIGLVNTLEDDEILDLLAFILSGGDPEDPLFQN